MRCVGYLQVVALENNMATPQAFVTPCGVLNTGMSLIVMLYVLLGSLGYNYCRAECKDSISLNLPTGTSVSIRYYFLPT